MRPADVARGVRRGLAYIALVAVAGGAALTLSQCKLVDERLTGVQSPLQHDALGCIKQCNTDANNAIRAESARHVAAVKACEGNETCLALEEATHEANVEKIQAARQECHDNCHKPGSGGSGL